MGSASSPSNSALLQVCVMLFGTWQVCVARGIDYGDYFHHGSQMKLSSTKAPFKCVDPTPRSSYDARHAALLNIPRTAPRCAE
eukprot:7387364-Pyramimonas_sp.AAC.2